ncbi:hypothetical protein [Flavobacterium selenitireducens]|uniref:hypothetical protein n=1 Tax=Flavobacterium selenitireducens TaxID=2722704 RepID=UPI00168A7395|nr:hypothetical protein [Flavobacterium selenitireducens]MBD3584066.1 hypothetical protein [Flavobacterium selenitireducens]
MKIILLILYFSVLFNAYSQSKMIFVNDDLEEITEKKYKSSLSSSEYRISYDLDTLTLNVRVQRIKEDKLSSDEYISIKNSLEKASGTKIQAGNTIVVDYFPGIDRCNTASIPKDPQILYFKEKYATEVSSLKKVNQFFVYKELEGTQAYGKKIIWTADENQIIEKAFFKLPYPCGSYVIIYSDGRYYSYKGEYNANDIIARLKNETSGNRR